MLTQVNYSKLSLQTQETADFQIVNNFMWLTLYIPSFYCTINSMFSLFWSRVIIFEFPDSYSWNAWIPNDEVAYNMGHLFILGIFVKYSEGVTLDLRKIIPACACMYALSRRLLPIFDRNIKVAFWCDYMYSLDKKLLKRFVTETCRSSVDLFTIILLVACRNKNSHKIMTSILYKRRNNYPILYLLTVNMRPGLYR